MLRDFVPRGHSSFQIIRANLELPVPSQLLLRERCLSSSWFWLHRFFFSRIFMSSIMATMAANGTGLGMTTIMMILLFGTNFFLYLLFQLIKISTRSNEVAVGGKEKKMSKPFVGTLDCFVNLTSELFWTGLILALTYICENHWFFEHSQKYYSRDLFIFVLILFFAYAFYTIKPNHDLALLGREQTEEWKGWMQFIFLLYHYFHAEEVYNSVRVMITCYVWMTGFGNFSFFYTKRDFGWLRMFQMLWRLNFSCILLMWTHGNTYILYYICPMHTFYFLVVYCTMYVWSSINTTKWGIRLKLLVLGILIYIIWDLNGGIFDTLFAWLGTDSVIGAKSGSVWEYYFRTSLDHWSTFFGMIFALNFPLAEQYFRKAEGAPLYLASVLMAAATVYWLVVYYPLEKMQYNLYHSYFAIIPLTSYIFFRNITPGVRSYISMSLHDLGKTTLETYLLQHHIWLTSNAKTLLTIVPGHPWINFALASMLFMTVSKELYRITMSLRGMVMPDDKNIAWTNTLGMGAILAIVYAGAYLMFLFAPSLIEILVACFALSLVVLLYINYSARHIYESQACRTWTTRAILAFAVALAGGIFLQVSFNTPSEGGSTPAVAVYAGNSPECLSAISQGHWVETRCDDSAPDAAFCQTAKWVWDNADPKCPIKKLTTSKLRSVYQAKKVLFAGDSEVRNVYHQFISILDPAYNQNLSTSAKHSNIHYAAEFDRKLSVDFVWAPMVSNITQAMRTALRSGADFHLIAAGASYWDALQGKSLPYYTTELEGLAAELAADAAARNTTKLVWIQPTVVVTDRLLTDEKREFMSEEVIQKHRAAFLASPAAARFDTIIDGTRASATKASKPVDGIHYSDDVYEVLAHMVSNGYTAHYPALTAKSSAKKPYVPKATGSMSFPNLGAFALGLAVIMLFSMDSWLGFGYLSLLLFGRGYDWEAGYAGLHRKIMAEEAGHREPPVVHRVASGGGGLEGVGDQEADSLLDPKTQL